MLPQTYQDAITICRNLSVRCRWIDSLCIIQHDALDWEQESSRMGDIYARSFLTIAASHSSDGSGGCFKRWSQRLEDPHDSAEAQSLGFSVYPYASPVLNSRLEQYGGVLARSHCAIVPATAADKASEVIIYQEQLPSSRRTKPRSRKIGTFGYRWDPLEHEPLNKWGWTLQERLLSTRIPHCGSNHMYWECREAFTGEDGSVFLSYLLDFNAIVEGQKLPLAKHGIESAPSISLRDEEPVIHGEWAPFVGCKIAVNPWHISLPHHPISKR